MMSVGTTHRASSIQWVLHVIGPFLGVMPPAEVGGPFPALPCSLSPTAEGDEQGGHQPGEGRIFG